MKSKGFIPSSTSYNSLVNALALNGEVEEALKYLWEMIEKQRSAEFITYGTVLDEICRQGKVGEAMRLLKEFLEIDLLNGHTYRKLLYVLEDDYGDSSAHSQFSSPQTVPLRNQHTTLRELAAKYVSPASLPLARALVASSSSSRINPSDLEDSLLQLVQEHHHASLRIHKLTEKAQNEATKKAVCVAELLVGSSKRWGERVVYKRETN
ncbi:unnamed protein product [Prunus armeniaca]